MAPFLARQRMEQLERHSALPRSLSASPCPSIASSSALEEHSRVLHFVCTACMPDEVRALHCTNSELCEQWGEVRQRDNLWLYCDLRGLAPPSPALWYLRPLPQHGISCTPVCDLMQAQPSNPAVIIDFLPGGFFGPYVVAPRFGGTAATTLHRLDPEDEP